MRTTVGVLAMLAIPSALLACGTSGDASLRRNDGGTTAAVGRLEVTVEPVSTTAGDGEAALEPFGAVVFYPAAGPGGAGVSVDPDGGRYPVIAFGHGYLGRVASYAETLRALAAEGYLIIAPTSQSGVLPDHSEFADELRASLSWLVERGSDPGSPFFGRVDRSRLGVSGHSMGGGCALLAAARDRRIRAVSTLAAADTRPSSLDLLDGIGCPVQSIAGSEDAIAPPAAFQVPLFEAVPPPRQLVIIRGGSHCGFLDDPPPLCDSGSLLPDDQIRLTRRLLRDWFGLFLKGDVALRPAVWEPTPDPRLEVIAVP